MPKKVLIIAGSPRKGGNSDMLCDAFAKGAQAAGHTTEKIYLQDKKIGFCKACYVCEKTGSCVQKDDVAAILDKMVEADVLVLATPVYFYCMSGQLKTFIDRTMPRYFSNPIAGKDVYFLLTAGEGREAIERAVESLRGFTDCLPDARIKGVVYGPNVQAAGEIAGKPAVAEAEKMGRSC